MVKPAPAPAPKPAPAPAPAPVEAVEHEDNAEETEDDAEEEAHFDGRDPHGDNQKRLEDAVRERLTRQVAADKEAEEKARKRKPNNEDENAALAREELKRMEAESANHMKMLHSSRFLDERVRQIEAGEIEVPPEARRIKQNIPEAQVSTPPNKAVKWQPGK